MAFDDLLHLLLDLLGQDTTTELLEESTVLRLKELSARRKLAQGKQTCLKEGTYKDFSQAVIFSTGTLSSIPLTPA